jgi:sulfite exporter TauE/SafE
MWVCAPILIPYIASTKKTWWEGLWATLVFSLVRTFAYTLLGLIAFLSYRLVEMIANPAKNPYLGLCAGIFVVFLGILLVVLRKEIHLPVFKLLGKEFLEKVTQSMILLGLLIGFSPCLPLIGALTLIATHAQSAFEGAFLGLSFGVGTLLSPLLILGLLAGFLPGEIIKNQKVFRIFKMVCGILLILFGLNLIVKRV